VVANEQDRLTNHCDDRVLVLLRQAVQEPWGILVSTTVSPGDGLLSRTLISES
jgi:hypothetical protein